jgi:uncharacterized membrane protein YfhO
MQAFDEKTMSGTIRIEHPSIVLFQMAFDPGWHAALDGKATAVLRADVGLLGVPVTPGEHQLRLWYVPPFLYSGAIISVLSLAILVFAWRRHAVGRRA